MIKIDQQNENFNTIPAKLPISIIGFVIAYLCLMINGFSIYKLYMRLEFKNNRFHLLIWSIVLSSFIISILFPIQPICDGTDLYQHYCTNRLLTISRIMWNLAYLTIYGLLLNAICKYNLLYNLYHWHFNATPILFVLGTISSAAIIILRALQLQISIYLIVFNVLFVYLFDVGMEILLLKKIYKTRSQCLVIPGHIKNAYIFTKQSIAVVVFVVPFTIVFLTLFSNDQNLFALFKYIIYLLLNIHVYTSVFSMIFVRNLAKLDPAYNSQGGS